MKVKIMLASTPHFDTIAELKSLDLYAYTKIHIPCPIISKLKIVTTTNNLMKTV